VTYVDAILEKDKNRIEVVERVNGQRVYTSWPSRYVVYFPSERGRYTSIFGQRMDKFETTRSEEFQRELRMIDKQKQYESDINPIFRCFYDHYKNAPSPKLNVAFFDIETNFDPLRGFSSPEEAFNEVTAISIYLNWLNKNFTLVIKPKTLTDLQAQEIVDKFEDSVLCENETQLLDVFLSLIEDADILTGWNSENYDIPYLYNRIVQVLSKEHTKRMCLWNKFPKRREYKSYGKDAVTYDLIGRVHLDYLQLYRKHTYHEMHSYRLDFVGEYEVGEHKIAYEGSLDTLYNYDFEKFIAYSRQDVMLLVKIDRKLQFIDLSNDLAHTNGVLLATTLGSVLLIDNAITNEAHDLGMVIPAKIRDDFRHNEIQTDDEDEDEEPQGIAGAFVAEPVKGLHSWIGGVDINSLYPSAIRALNMSRETVVGQIRPIVTDKNIYHRINNEKKSFADAWNDTFGTWEYNMVMNQEQGLVTVDFEDGNTVELSAAELYDWIFNNQKKSLILSANGTIFDLGREGIIPGLLKKWYGERVDMKNKQKKIDKIKKGIELPERLLESVNQLLAINK
jgi:DNA polymerase elongation subunit (family B)